ncbi:hypothetical protein V8F33_013256 [Rhypophila sp. PSN 637]
MIPHLAVLTALASSAIAANAALADSCNTRSFTIPSWLIENYTTTGSRTSFRVLNRATNTTTNLVCQATPGSDGTSSCTASSSSADQGLVVSLQPVNSTSSRVLLNQTWSCNDVKPLTFTATGSGLLSSICAPSEICITVIPPPTLIKGSLLIPVSITPSYGSGPTGHDNEGCAALSRTPSWELSASQIARRTSFSSDGTTTMSGNAFIQVTNHVTGSATGCLIQSFSRAGGFQVMDCQEQAPYRPRDKYRVNTEAMFDQDKFELVLNETWFCDDVSSTASIQFTATSHVSLPLECQDFPIEGSKDLVVFCTGSEEANPVWNGTLIAEERLPAYESLQDPLPNADSCTVSSVLSPAWRIGNLAANTNPGGSVGSLTFQIELATGDTPGSYPATIIQSWEKLSGNDENTEGNEAEKEGEWYTCGFPEGEQPEHLTACTFLYDANKKTLALNATWTCRDLDREHPIYFSGITNHTIPDLSCQPVAGSNETRCATTRGKAWTAAIESVRWHQ